MSPTSPALTLSSYNDPAFDAFFQLPAGLLCIAGMDTRLLRVNRGWLDLLGWDEEEVLGRPYTDFLHPEDLASANAEHSSVSGGAGSVLFECRMLCKDGSYRVVQWNSNPNIDEGVVYAMGWDVTEMRKTERWLKLLETVAVSTNDGVCILQAPDADSDEAVILFANDALAAATGYTKAELVGKSSAMFTGVATDSDSVQANRRKLRSEQQLTGRSQMHRKDGTAIWVEYSSRAVQDPDHNRMLWISIIREVTERVEAERELEESSERYQLLFESNPAPMWVYDVETLRFLAVNEAAVDTYGYSKEQFLQMTIKDIRREEDVPALENLVATPQKSLRNAGLWTHLYADGSEHFVRITSHWINFMGRRATLVLAFDVTEAVTAQAKLRESNQLLNGIIESSALAIVSFDDHGLIRTWNPAAERILGRPAAEAVGTPIDDAIKGSSKTVGELRDRLSQRQPFTSFETTIKRRGERIDLSVSLSLLDEDDPQHSGMVAVIEDVSHRVQAERALRDLNKTLERRVTERTVALTSANKELEAFCFSVSHDLRGPLRSIDGFSRAVMEDYADKLDDTGRDYLNRVRAATQRLGSLIDSLLALSRLTRVPMFSEEIDLSAIASEVLGELASRDPERQVSVDVQPGATSVGDPRLIRLVVENLLDNAWKFTSLERRPAISFSYEESDGETVYRVRDNGVGFDMKYAGKLFLPFERLHSDKAFPGNGIGLATVERTVARHGGRVWAEGAEGKGASFFFTLSPTLFKG